tara:strand:- start:90 stop:467 length:378 start_codon:yes stop_codon:yes gene_type:complete
MLRILNSLLIIKGLNIMNNNLNKKIKEVLNNEDKSYAYLNSIELLALVKMQRVTHIRIKTGLDSYISENSSEYYPSTTSLHINKKQALVSAQDFAKFSEIKDQVLLARVYISTFGVNEDKLYITL